MDSILEQFEGYMDEICVIIPRPIVKSNDPEMVFSVLSPTPETYNILKKTFYVASPEPIRYITKKYNKDFR